MLALSALAMRNFSNSLRNIPDDYLRRTDTGFMGAHCRYDAPTLAAEKEPTRAAHRAAGERWVGTGPPPRRVWGLQRTKREGLH
jgi:hypothetical protein